MGGGFSDGCVCGKRTQYLEKREKNIICLMCVGHMMHMKHMKFGRGFFLTPSTAAGGPPPSRREVWGFRRSRPTALPSIEYRGFAVAPMTLRAPSRKVVITSEINGRAMRAPTGDGGATDGCNDATLRCKHISQLQFSATL